MKRKELIFPILVLAVAILGTIVLVLRGHDLANYLQDDVFALLAQFVLVSGIGGIISVVLAEFTRARERRQQLRDLQRKTFSDLVEAYHEVKRLRRLLRARAVRLGASGKKETVDRDEYDTLLQRLNDVQLQCEFYKRYAEGNQDIYGAAGPELVANLGQAELCQRMNRLRIVTLPVESPPTVLAPGGLTGRCCPGEHKTLPTAK